MPRNNKAVTIPKPTGEILPRKSVPVYVNKGESDPKQFYREHAKVLTAPETAAYRVIDGAERKSGLGEQLDVPTLLEDLRKEAEAINNGDMRRIEAMLANQATALQSLSARLIERAMAHSEAVPFELNMRMGLRAQAQCRAALEALAEIKNPRPIAFVKQANIANGPQQVNNGEASRAQEKLIQSNEQSGAKHELLPDARASAIASGANSKVATLGKINRPKVARREGKGR